MSWRTSVLSQQSTSIGHQWQHTSSIGQQGSHAEVSGARTTAGSHAAVDSTGQAGVMQDNNTRLDIEGLTRGLQSRLQSDGGQDGLVSQQRGRLVSNGASTGSRLERGVTSKEGNQTSSEGSVGVNDQIQRTAQMLESAIQNRLGQITSGQSSESYVGESNNLKQAQSLARKFSASLSESRNLAETRQRLESASGGIAMNITRALNDAIVNGVGLESWNNMNDTQKAAFGASALAGRHERLMGQTSAGAESGSIGANAVTTHHADAGVKVHGRAGQLPEGVGPRARYDNGKGRWNPGPANRPRMTGDDPAIRASASDLPMPANPNADSVTRKAATGINDASANVEAGKVRITTDAAKARDEAKAHLENAEPLAVKGVKMIRDAWNGEK